MVKHTKTEWKPGRAPVPPKPWLKGQSGNPSGLTKTMTRFRELRELPPAMQSQVHAFGALYRLALAGVPDEKLAETAKQIGCLPEVLDRAKEMAGVTWKAAQADELWGRAEVCAQLAPVQREQRSAAKLTLSAEVSAEGNNDVFEAFYSRILESASRLSAKNDSEDAGTRAIEGAAIPVEVLGPAEPDGTAG
jgi:hypothetical protein